MPTAAGETEAAMAITFEAYARSNGAFKTPRPMPQGSPAGIIIHSTGADNPNLKRYVNAPEICGANPYKNYFDRPDSNVCPHAVISRSGSPPRSPSLRAKSSVTARRWGAL